MSPYDCNVLDAFPGWLLQIGADPSECKNLIDEMDSIYLKFKTKDHIEAEKCALDWGRVGAFLKEPLGHAISLYADNPNILKPSDDTVSGLMEFIQKRLVNMRFPKERGHQL